MKQSGSNFRKIISVLYLLVIHSLAGLFIYQSLIRPYIYPTENYALNVTDPTQESSIPTPQPIPSLIPAMPEQPEINANQAQNPNQAESNVISESAGDLMIPVIGIRRDQLQDTYNDARSEGRVHNAIDIMAPSGTPIVAAADGEIAKLFDSQLGGITIYQYSTDHRFVYYYAHLQKRADNLNEKDFVKRGTIIGFVGDTGNAGAGNCHLHFSIATLADPKRYWEGTDINPYPLLKNAIEAH